ncbi:MULTISPECIES: hypothetical protein [Geodermatophilus]|uniref:Uncharacterized protein n=1 Tax=Geodermatophilus arenarius TaxID=1137990 RepID=A0ABV9LP58_9ACTN
MVVALELDQPCAGDVVGEVPADADRDHQVTAAVQHQGRDPDGGSTSRRPMRG